MKKILLTIAAISILVFVGTAFAHGGWRPGGDGGFGPHGSGRFDGETDGEWRGGHHGWGRLDAEAPQEIIAKRSEAIGILTELRSEMSKKPINRERALELYRKHRTLKSEIEEWFFLKRLDNISQGVTPRQ
ncbi:MAG: hypothetical protein LBQ19_00315 [Synergistaceae bacterium]|nr:hypothetical protein [Synergistaceae bacterium]